MNPIPEANSSSLPKKVIALNLSLHPLQEKIINCGARFIHLICGRQWGKTYLDLYWLIQGCQKPNSVVWYVAPHKLQAKDTAWPKLREILPPGIRLLETDLTVVFPNQSRLSLKGGDDKDIRRGPALSRMVMDEAQDFDDDDFDTVFRPLLSAKQAPAILSGTKKPGNWFLRRWLDVEERKVPEATAFHFPSWTNPTIPQEEWEKTRQMLFATDRSHLWFQEYEADPHNVKGLKQGLKFPEFDRSLHMVNPFVILPGWKRYRGIDWGMDHPTACVWAARDPKDGTIYIYEEHVARGLHAEHQATIIISKTGRVKIETSVMDRSCWHTESDGSSVAARFIKVGIPVIKGDREDKAGSGTSAVKEFLKPVEGSPKLKIFAQCENLMREMEKLTWEDKKGNDSCDALTYLIGFLKKIPIGDTIKGDEWFDSNKFIREPDGKGGWIYRHKIPDDIENVQFDSSGYIA